MMITSFLSIPFLLSIAVINSAFASDDVVDHTKTNLNAYITPHDMSRTPTESDVECTQKDHDKFLSWVETDGSYHTKTCGWLNSQTFKNRRNHCRKDYDSVDGLSAAKDGCPVTCEMFDFYLVHVNSNDGSYTKRTCLWLNNNRDKKHDHCSRDILSVAGLKSAKNTCKLLCGTCSAGPLSSNVPSATPTKAPSPAPSTTPTKAPSSSPESSPSCTENQYHKYLVFIQSNGHPKTRTCRWLSLRPAKKLLHCQKTASHGHFRPASLTCPVTCGVCH